MNTKVNTQISLLRELSEESERRIRLSKVEAKLSKSSLTKSHIKISIIRTVEKIDTVNYSKKCFEVIEGKYI